MGEDTDRGPLGSRAREAAKPPTLAEARAKVIELVGPENDDTGAKSLPKNYTFEVDYHDQRRNRRWSGSFRAHVLSLGDQLQFGRLLAQLRGNVPEVALDFTTASITEMAAYITTALDEAPVWARGNKLLDMMDAGVLAAVYKEVRDYEARFWGADGEGEDQGDGA